MKGMFKRGAVALLATCASLLIVCSVAGATISSGAGGWILVDPNCPP